MSARLEQVRESKPWEEALPAELTALVSSVKAEWPATEGFAAMYVRVVGVGKCGWVCVWVGTGVCGCVVSTALLLLCAPPGG